MRKDSLVAEHVRTDKNLTEWRAKKRISGMTFLMSRIRKKVRRDTRPVGSLEGMRDKLSMDGTRTF